MAPVEQNARGSSVLAAVFAWACAVLCACGPTSATPCEGPGVLCRVAGTGLAAFDGDGKPAKETSLYLPSAVRRGPDGLVYVMDFNNHRLRRVDGDGALRTVVGIGLHAVAVEGATALMTPLENPIDFGFDAEGAIVLVAYHDPRILRVGAAGVVEVLAGTGDLGDDGDGGPALAAHFTQLAGMAVAADGRIAVSDDKAHRVRIVDGTTVKAVAGESGNAGFAGDGGLATEARLSSPRGLAFDAEGRLYVADSGNHRIRRIDTNGLVTTVAGNGTPGAGGDDGPATEAELRGPEGVFVAADGSLYVADTGNHRIRRVDAAGVISTFAGSTRGSSGDGGQATAAQLQSPSRIDGSDEALLIADQRNHLVRAVGLR
jgi:sugar lactone lactonase YvrE